MSSFIIIDMRFMHVHLRDQHTMQSADTFDGIRVGITNAIPPV